LGLLGGISPSNGVGSALREKRKGVGPIKFHPGGEGRKLPLPNKVLGEGKKPLRRKV